MKLVNEMPRAFDGHVQTPMRLPANAPRCSGRCSSVNAWWAGLDKRVSLSGVTWAWPHIYDGHIFRLVWATLGTKRANGFYPFSASFSTCIFFSGIVFLAGNI